MTKKNKNTYLLKVAVYHSIFVQAESEEEAQDMYCDIELTDRTRTDSEIKAIHLWSKGY